MKKLWYWCKGFVTGLYWFVILLELFLVHIIWCMYKNEQRSKSGPNKYNYSARYHRAI